MTASTVEQAAVKEINNLYKLLCTYLNSDQPTTTFISIKKQWYHKADGSEMSCANLSKLGNNLCQD